MTFADLALPPPLVAALAKQNITEPMDIQVAAWPVLMDGRHAYINSETGTGKTLAYLLPLFARMEVALAATQVIIVVPTHELALQIQRQSCDLAVNAQLPIRTLLLIGGTSLDRQIEKLKKKPQVVVGSPGRIRELIAMGKLKGHTARCVVMDEADRLLCGESAESVRLIIQAVPKTCQLIFASATEQDESEREIAALAPGVVMLRTAVAPVNPNIAHSYLVCEERDKPDVLRKLLHATQAERAIVFVHRNDTAEIVAAKLAHHKVPVADLHGAFVKSERKRAMDDFRSGRARVLIASDVAARGLDIPGVTHIFNLDAPTLSKAYLHRVGRTARAGAKGQAVSLLTEPEVRLVRRYEADLGITMTPIILREGEVRLAR
ncbi:MAG: DEAD/DEAH box helicase [Lentisphaerae bacterium]|nr:DEAD/DEAH box helicase [Lentisphaerota bacterium]